MIYLALSIFFSSLIFLIFKSYSRYKIDTFPAIVINYIVAAIFGYAISKDSIPLQRISENEWFIYAIALGVCFIGIFYLMALTSQKIGAATASVSNKMAVIIPIFFGVYLYNDELNTIKIIGITLALIGLYLATKKDKLRIEKYYWFLPILLFLSSGFLDSFVKYVQHFYLGSSAKKVELFTPTLFSSAALVGVVLLLFQWNRIKRIHYHTLLGGLILGIVNYYSIYFIIKALAYKNIESLVIFPINNMGVVAFTTIASYFIFKERLSKLNQLGILICLFSIILIALSR